MIETLNICDGKYTTVFNTETGEFKALRYGEEWQNLSGNKFVYGLHCEVLENRKKIEALLKLVEAYKRMLHSCKYGNIITFKKL